MPSVTSQYNLALCKAVRKSIVFLWRIINTLLHSSAGMYIQHTVGNLVKFSSLTSYLNSFSFSVGCKWRMKHEFKYMYLIKIQVINIQVLMVLGNYWLFPLFNVVICIPLLTGLIFPLNFLWCCLSLKTLYKVKSNILYDIKIGVLVPLPSQDAKAKGVVSFTQLHSYKASVTSNCNYPFLVVAYKF